MSDKSALFSDRLREVMDELQVKPAELAGAVGVSISAVLQWLGGTTKSLKPENLFAVADALGLEARWLGTGKGGKWSQRTGPLRRVAEVPPPKRGQNPVRTRKAARG